MASNSLASILEKMKLGSITAKWGAVCAFDRERLNRVLQQQWLEKYDGTTYVPVFSGQMDLNDRKTEYGVLTNIHLGKPLLSFEPAALDNSRALLTLSILGGTFTAYEKNHGVMYSYTITEAQGYTLKIKLDLSLVVGDIDRLGRVTLDLSKGIDFSCNLAGPVASQQRIGQYFADRFKALPRERQVYELGMLNLNGGSDLTPTNFIILTQRAPGADQPGALNVGDGAVVVMIKLRGSATGGDIPSTDRLPFLIPDDMENGVRKYSATMVLAKEFIERSDDDKLELIRSVLFPGQRNVFVEHERHVPHDLVIFGSLDPSKTSLTIEPAVHSLKAGGEPVSYKALLNGAAVSGVEWSVKSLNTNGSSGSIDSVSGVYRPVSAELIGKQSVRNIVTAAYTDTNGQKHRVSALLLVTTEAMTISPGCVPRNVGGERVTFVATALSGSTLTWSTPEFGTLVANGNTAVYTPPGDPESLPDHFVVQPIEVRDGAGETVQACVLLTKFAATTTIEPPFVSALARSATVDLKVTETLPPDLEWRWEVLGDGTVTDGTFTAPAKSSRHFSVVKCDIYMRELLVRTGYSIIQLTNFTPEPRLGNLTKFRLHAAISNKLYANGYQQVPLEARIETDGAKLTPDQEASLRLYYLDSDQVVPDVPSLQDGIPYDPDMPVLWSQTRIQNRFKQPPGRMESDPVVAGKTNVPLFVVSRSTQVTRFYAGFVDDESDKFYRSDVHPGHEDGIIELLPQRSPDIAMTDYTFERRRISEEGTGSEDNDDDFDLYLKTIDYWDLSYKREGSVNLHFAALEFPGVPGFPGTPRKDPFISTVRWESTFHNEQMFTYTGYAFNDPKDPRDHGIMKFDSIIKNNKVLKDHYDPGLVGELAEGRFLIGVFRRTDVRQADYPNDPSKLGNPDLNPLKAGVKLILTDNEGHRHPLEIKFATDRNRPVLSPLRE